jgi:hypothetical protein
VAADSRFVEFASQEMRMPKYVIEREIPGLGSWTPEQ